MLNLKAILTNGRLLTKKNKRRAYGTIYNTTLRFLLADSRDPAFGRTVTYRIPD